MSIFADHSWGIFNLWMMAVLYSLPILLTITFRKRVFATTSSRFNSSRSSDEKKYFIISKILMLIYFLYSIVVPAHLGTVVGMIGLTLFIIGFVIYTTAWITIARSEKGKIFSSGPFRYSRHPIYVASTVQFIGAGFISQSWFYLGLSILVGMSHMRNAIVEERICIETFGDEYKHYMALTPRWLGWPVPTPNEHK